MNDKFEKLISRFKTNHRDLKVTAVIDYDEKYLVIEALAHGGEKDYNDPLYAIDKNSGRESNFSPAFDFDKFFEAAENRMIFSETNGD